MKHLNVEDLKQTMNHKIKNIQRQKYIRKEPYTDRNMQIQERKEYKKRQTET